MVNLLKDFLEPVHGDQESRALVFQTNLNNKFVLSQSTW